MLLQVIEELIQPEFSDQQCHQALVVGLSLLGLASESQLFYWSKSRVYRVSVYSASFYIDKYYGEERGQIYHGRYRDIRKRIGGRVRQGDVPAPG